ncbi:ClC family H(+)/Cl(-) exchange transporter [Streptococcus massiliensis]|uniref:Voltage gated chloride channel EriC n=1 Tax=Streptococcus massiliensis TaxID=313439 RepID=A0A380KX75_9STRE|nr:ClC family H(+)/Cl(-) exchange transporter [Streptococcus massiliensis]SUN75869.1 voltage gated chloride channel EriC [Streptococcus massiliensis]
MTKSSDQKKEYEFAASSILIQVLRGIAVGIFAGIVVGSFRLLISEIFKFFFNAYQDSHSQFIWLGVIGLAYLFIAWINAKLIQSDKDIKGSGIPNVEAELKGLMGMDWWDILWKKFLAGVLAISSGLMLGREGPSIQLGAAAGKGLGKYFKLSPLEQRTLIAAGAGAGLAAAFNAPIAGLLFVVEEVYHHFTRFVWVTTLAASLTANFVSQTMFGLKPVLGMPDVVAHLDLTRYWIYLLLGVVLGLAGYVYEWAILRIGKVYHWLGDKLHLSPNWYSLLAFVLILPLGYFSPQLLGGGNELILSLPIHRLTFSVLVIYFFLRFIFSMISYGSGLPGGIFLPLLALGSLLGAVLGHLFVGLDWVTDAQFPLFIILGMSGYFGAVSKAPLTAMILVTEMVGDIRSLMPLGIVTLVAYTVMDLLHGAPVYEALLEQMLPENLVDEGETTLIEIPVSEKIAGRQVHELELPHDILITTQIHGDKEQTVNGSTRLYLGDTILLVVKKNRIAQVKELLLDN